MKKISRSKNSVATQRTRIDALDKKIIALIAQRLKIACKIAQEKKRLNLTIRQPERMASLLAERKKMALTHTLNPAFILKVYKIILDESMKIQKRQLAKKHEHF
ncbi:MAG: chorismate mutase [Candidatus Omnitrophica bacterium]|nr:chorismate mutase [Candidatus Omnitrophota bacterium]